LDAGYSILDAGYADSTINDGVHHERMMADAGYWILDTRYWMLVTPVLFKQRPLLRVILDAGNAGVV
jgi:hypothetical protein|tara:strand:+ start:170 stop:370 length:201 start_codon:yes stop_codon:yes gene_type:complete